MWPFPRSQTWDRLAGLPDRCSCWSDPSLVMPPKAKVIEARDLGRGVTFEVRPAIKGSPCPTVHVIVDNERLPAFCLKEGSSAEAQVRLLPAVTAQLATS